MMAMLRIIGGVALVMLIGVGGAVALPTCTDWTIAYSSGLEGSDMDIYVYRDGDSQPFVTSPQYDGMTSWAPDGERVAYTTAANGTHEIHVRNTTTNESRAILGGGRGLSKHDWSPDGQALVYMQEGHLYTYRFDGTGVELLFTDGRADYPAWAPDSRTIIYTSCNVACDLFRYDTATGRNLRLTSNLGAQGERIYPAVSPDGRTLAYTALNGQDGTKIHLMDMTTGRAHRLTTLPREISEFTPSWSPDGRMIVFATRHGDAGDIYVADVRVGAALPLVASPAMDILPVWVR